MLLDELGGFIAANGYGTLHVDIHLQTFPDTPDIGIALVEYGGAGPTYSTSSDEIDTERPRVQVIVRNPEYEAAKITAYALYRLFGRTHNITLTGAGTTARYLKMMPVQSPYDMGEDDQGRERVQFNLEIEKGLSL